MATNPNNLPATQERKAVVRSGEKVAAMVPTTLAETFKLSQAIAASGMAPKAYGADENKIMVGIIAGMEVGLTPFAALQSIAVIGNNPAIWGDGALALVQASGLLDDMEETDDGNTATCRLVRRGRTTPIVRSFSTEDAKKAGLSGKSGPWTQYPARMRQMRARGFALRDGFSDVLKGLRIAEEVRDYGDISSVPTMHPTAPLTTAALIAQADPDTGEIIDAVAEPSPRQPSEPPSAGVAQQSVESEATDNAPAETLYAHETGGEEVPSLLSLATAFEDALKAAPTGEELGDVWNAEKALRKRMKDEMPDLLRRLTSLRDDLADKLSDDGLAY